MISSTAVERATSQINHPPPRMILYGGTGQAKAVRPMLEHYGGRVVAVFDDTPGLRSPFTDVPIYRGYDALREWVETQPRAEIGFCVTIGNPHGRVRLQLHDRLVALGLSPVTITHPTAWIAEDATIGAGSQILAGAIVGADACVGRQCIVNHHALVEHETVLSDAVELAPRATVLGLTHIGTNTLIGAGAMVLSRLRIGSDVLIGAGAVVSSDVADGETVQGPATRSM